MARSRSWATLVRAVSVARCEASCERKADWSVLRREWEDGRREQMIDSSREREQKNGERGSGDVGQVKVFTFFFKRDDIKAFYKLVGGERGKVLQKRKWMVVKAKSLRRRERIGTQLEKTA